MKSMVVLFGLCAVACGSLVAQPPHLPALVLDPHGRPLETAEVINSRALHLQAKALEANYGHGAFVAPYGHSVALAPSYGYTAPLLAHAGLSYASHSHYLYKRSLGLYSHHLPSAVVHQSRVEVHTGPSTIGHGVIAPLVHAAVVPVAHHGVLAKINHAAIAPIGYAASYNYGHGYYNSADPFVHAW